ncbi:MAG: GIY-YIG nuclease family protein [Planctomycetota bacterium]|jgi:hypothetical protein
MDALGDPTKVMFYAASDEPCEFGVSDWPVRLPNIPGVYVFAQKVIQKGSLFKYRPIYISTAKKLGDEVSKHELEPRMERDAVNCVCIHLETNELARIYKRDKLIKRYRPSCNK